MFSLSPLSTAHPRLLQQTWVRTSSACYRTFILAMDRSSGFGSTPSNSTPCSDSLSLRLPYSVKLATERKSLTHYTKGTQSPLHKEPYGFFVLHKIYFELVLLTRLAPRRKNPKMLCAGAPTVCMHAVSGSISLPSRGSFRLSLTVLVHYRSITSI